MIQDSLWKILGIIICVVMLFVVPTLSIYQRQEDIAYNILLNEANSFSQKVREIGYIDQPLLNQLNGAISSLGMSFEVTLEHQVKKFASDEGEYKVFYEGIYTTDIYKEIEINKRYSMAMGDFFYIRIKNTSTSAYGSIKRMLGFGNGTFLYVVSGGIVRYGNS